MEKIIAIWTFLAIFVQAENKQVQAITEITSAAQAFLSSLSPEVKGKAEFAFTDAEREHWKFTPQPRNGVSIELPEDRQQ